MLFATGLLLAGCSYSPPKWVNPTTWFDSKGEQSEAEAGESENEPTPARVEPAKPPADGLLGDGSNATYSDRDLKVRPTPEVDAPRKPEPAEPEKQPEGEKQSAVPMKGKKSGETIAKASANEPVTEDARESERPVAMSEQAGPSAGETVAKPDPLQIVQKSGASRPLVGQTESRALSDAEPGQLPEVKSIVQGRPPIAPARSSDPARRQLASTESPVGQGTAPARAPELVQQRLVLIADNSQGMAEEEKQPRLILGGEDAPEATIWPVVLRFEQGKRLASGEAAQLKALADRLQQLDGTIHIAGHASSRASGREATDRMLSNFALSLGRAEYVAKYLERHGIPGDRMVLEGYGDQSPAVPHESPVAEVINRRVEIYLR